MHRSDYDDRERYPSDPSDLASLGVIYGITEIDTRALWKHPPAFAANDIFRYVVDIQRLVEFDFGYGSDWIVLGPTGTR